MQLWTKSDILSLEREFLSWNNERSSVFFFFTNRQSVKFVSQDRKQTTDSKKKKGQKTKTQRCVDDRTTGISLPLSQGNLRSKSRLGFSRIADWISLHYRYKRKRSVSSFSRARAPLHGFSFNRSNTDLSLAFVCGPFHTSCPGRSLPPAHPLPIACAVPREIPSDETSCRHGFAPSPLSLLQILANVRQASSSPLVWTHFHRCDQKLSALEKHLQHLASKQFSFDR